MHAGTLARVHLTSNTQGYRSLPPVTHTGASRPQFSAPPALGAPHRWHLLQGPVLQVQHHTQHWVWAGHNRCPENEPQCVPLWGKDQVRDRRGLSDEDWRTLRSVGPLWLPRRSQEALGHLRSHHSTHPPALGRKQEQGTLSSH